MNEIIYLRNTDSNGFFKFTRMLENPSIYKAFVSEHGKNVFNGVKYVVCFNKSKGVKGIKGSCFKYFKTYEIKGIIRENGNWKSNEIKEKYLSVFGNDSDYKEHVLKNVPWIWDLNEIKSERDDHYHIFVKFPKVRNPYWFKTEPEVLKIVENKPVPNPNRKFRIYKITFQNGKHYVGKDFEKNNKWSHYMGSYDRKYVIDDLESSGFPMSEFPIPWKNKEILWESDYEYCDKTGLHFGFLENYFINKYRTNELEFGYNQTGRKK